MKRGSASEELSEMESRGIQRKTEQLNESLPTVYWDVQLSSPIQHLEYQVILFRQEMESFILEGSWTAQEKR